MIFSKYCQQDQDMGKYFLSSDLPLFAPLSKNHTKVVEDFCIWVIPPSHSKSMLLLVKIANL